MYNRPINTVFIAVTLLWPAACLAAPSVHISSDTTAIGMGESIALTSQVTAPSPAGHRVIPFVNGKRWGAIEVTGDDGKATHHLPLPHPGIATVQVLVQEPLSSGARAQWIWGPKPADTPTHFFQRVFNFTGTPAEAVLYVAVDDDATVYLNGQELGSAQGWQQGAVFDELSSTLVLGDNVLSIEAGSSAGLAGLLVRLDGSAAMPPPAVVSDGAWSRFDRAPYGWPFRAEEDGQAVTVLSGVEWSPWRRHMENWPTLTDRSLDMAGMLLPENGVLSAPLAVTVSRRALAPPTDNPAQRIGVQYAPWFTPGNLNWASSQAVPLTGPYWSWNTDVIRQQMIWLIESGVDFLVVDWTNHLWEKAHWHERGDAANEIVHATTQLLETLAQLRDEALKPPAVVLYLGLNNGPSTTVQAMNEAMEWIYHTYVRNPRFQGLFEYYLDKPLLLVHNGGGPGWVDGMGAVHVDDTRFTIRYQSFHHELNNHAAQGFWSWMDATLEPVVTYFEDKPEALTVSTGFFSRGGWKKEGAHGRKGGWTLVEGFKQAFAHRPGFLEVHQYQAFAGQWEGFGYGDQKDVYVDAYSVELSDEIEPVSLTAHGYRGEGGWGFYYLNLLRALVDCYQQADPETTVLAMDHPGYGATVHGDTLPLRWTWVGSAPAGFRLLVNGRAQEFPAEATETTLDLSTLSPGEIDIELIALGTLGRYALSYTEASLPVQVPADARTSTVLRYAP